MHRSEPSPYEEMIFGHWRSYDGVTNFGFEIVFDYVDSGQ